jgi:AraC-like DNA-binding protein
MTTELDRGTTDSGHCVSGSRIIWRPVAIRQVEILQVKDSDARCGMFQDRYMIALSSGCTRTIRYRHRIVEQEKGTFVLIEPGEVHVSRPASGLESMDVMFIDPPIVRRIAAAEGIGDVHWRVLTAVDNDLACDFRTTLASLRCDKQEARVAFDVFVGRAIRCYAVGHFHSDRIGQDRALVRDARELLHDRMVDRISIKEIAKQLGVSPSHLVRSFSAELGTPPHRYLVHVRVERARALIANGLSAIDSAHAVGFADQSHLHRHFTKIIGLTPGEYARTVRGHDVSSLTLL